MRTTFILLCLSLWLVSSRAEAQGYEIKVNLPSMAGKKLLLGFYMDQQAYIADSTKLDASGNGTFGNNGRKLAKGMYFLYFSPSNIFDLLIGNNQRFSIKTDTTDPIGKTQISGSPENIAFLDFQRFMASQTRQDRAIREEYKNEPDKEKPETQKKYSARLDQLYTDGRSYVTQLCARHPGSSLATFARFTLPPDLPDFTAEVPEGTPDRDTEIQRKAYFYKKAHYWDNTDLTDSTLVRTQLLKGKLDDFFNNYVLTHPDSVCGEATRLIEKAGNCKTMYRYLVVYCYNYTIEKANTIMGMDAAYATMSRRYYLSGKAFWTSPKDLEEIRKNVAKLQYNLIGMTAQELKLPTLENRWVSLHETKAPFTLVLFWESNCGHCKKQMPEIKTKLLDRFKPYGFKVFAVHTQNSKEEWEKFVTEHNLFDFINCWDPRNQSNFHNYYDIVSTPAFFLLDKDKKIIAKKVDIDAIADMLQKEYGRMGIEIK